MAPFRIRVEVPEISGMEGNSFLERAESFLWLLLTALSSRKKQHLNISHWYPACVDDNPMASSSENKNGYYQSIKKYDGSDPTYFPAFIAAVTDHYATWRK